MALTTPDGSSKSVVSPESNRHFMMDSGGPDSYFPSSVVEEMVVMLEPYGLVKGHKQGSYMAPCGIVDQPGGLDLRFLGGRGDASGPSYRIHFRDLFDDKEKPEQKVDTKIGACQFLRSVYVVTNLDERTVGLAQAVDRASELTDIQEIKASDDFGGCNSA
ncbi:hypothetical protein LTR78_008180 [Recurvomyces mirabilis]|uniref:Peptidase A1 domain-containing protein n=1 Tax=Recurvomyces mirabilis TaxID=574656 RepID=A0AAE0TQK9_9PEZI|nr:hypothetical protein LTR78_008180 [Recurvomyces mirabilis]KAK5150621.1 Candidapepsin-7 [Recurvomyces mirabilis]